MASEVVEILQRIEKQQGVVGTVIINVDGIPVKTNLDLATSAQYSALFSKFMQVVIHVIRDLDPFDDLLFLRLRSKKNEIMIAPDVEYTFLVIQNHTAE